MCVVRLCGPITHTCVSHARSLKESSPIHLGSGVVLSSALPPFPSVEKMEISVPLSGGILAHSSVGVPCGRGGARIIVNPDRGS